MSSNAHVEFLGNMYQSPIWAASGTFGWGVEALDGNFLPQRGLGAVVLKGLSAKPMAGAAQPRIVETGSGMGLINAIGLENPGAEFFLAKYASRFDRGEFPLPLWVNVFGHAKSEITSVIDALRTHMQAKRTSWLLGFELNLSCPNTQAGGLEFGIDPDVTEDVVGAVVAAAGAYPVIAKLSPWAGPKFLDVARAAVAAGAGALTLGNTFPAGIPEPDTLDAHGNVVWGVGRRYGGLSGPALKPIQLRLIDQIVAAGLSIPICAAGGVRSLQDVKEYLSAGASVVQIGTGNLSNPWLAEEIWDRWKTI